MKIQRSTLILDLGNSRVFRRNETKIGSLSHIIKKNIEQINIPISTFSSRPSIFRIAISEITTGNQTFRFWRERVAIFYSPDMTLDGKFSLVAFRAFSFTFYNWAQRGSMNEGARIIIGIITASGAVKRIYRGYIVAEAGVTPSSLRHRNLPRVLLLSSHRSFDGKKSARFRFVPIKHGT